MNTDMMPNDAESSYFIGSANSSTATESDRPGTGRIIGNLYSFVGKRIEKRLSTISVRLGYGPRATAVRIRRILQSTVISKRCQIRKLERESKRLTGYIR